ncbi:MAG: pentapeptide repeat-containing protein [Thainema sp.]
MALGANLINTNFRETNLCDAKLAGALLIEADLSTAKNLSLEQLDGDEQPYLCGVTLPSNMDKSLSNRDCDKLPQIIANRDNDISIEEAKQIVEKALNKQWD